MSVFIGAEPHNMCVLQLRTGGRWTDTPCSTVILQQQLLHIVSTEQLNINISINTLHDDDIWFAGFVACVTVNKLKDLKSFSFTLMKLFKRF